MAWRERTAGEGFSTQNNRRGDISWQHTKVDRLEIRWPSGQAGVLTDIPADPLPQAFTLSQNFPNPFSGDTIIRFALPDRGEVELAVYKLAGQRVAKLVEGVREAGAYTVRWDGRDDLGRELVSGLYPTG